jgi:hypothetical protein
MLYFITNNVPLLRVSKTPVSNSFTGEMRDERERSKERSSKECDVLHRRKERRKREE